jgi:hypothetical protein
MIPDETLRKIFGPASGKWGVAQLWHDATFGEIEFLAPLIVDVGVLPFLGFDGSKNPKGEVNTPPRGTTMQAAKALLSGHNFQGTDNDVFVVMISPPPSDAGGDGGNGCLLDVNGTQTFMTQEFGHALGFEEHSWGPSSGKSEVIYKDPYCVMSGDDWDGKAPYAEGLVDPPPPGLPAGWDKKVGPLPVAAFLWRYSDDFKNSAAVATLDASLNPQKVSLTSYGAASTVSNPVLAVIRAQKYTWCVEYRGSHGWDRGIGLSSTVRSNAVPTAIVIHRLSAAGNITYVDVIAMNSLGRYRKWSAPNDDFTVQLTGQATDDTWVTVRVEAPHLEAVRLEGQTSPDGVACASVAKIFVNEDHYVAWTGTGNKRLNVAASNTSKYVAEDDTAKGNLALASVDKVIWVAWSGTNAGHNLNLFVGTPDHIFDRKIFRPNDSSPCGPALGVLNGRVYLAYRGMNNGLYVVDGADDPQSTAHRVEQETTEYSPALTGYAGRLYLAWIGTDSERRINILSSTDGNRWDNKWTFDEYPAIGLALLGAEPARLYVAGTDALGYLHLGTLDVTDLNSANPSGHFRRKITFPSTSFAAPGLCATTNEYDLIMAWVGPDGPGNIYKSYLASPLAN